MDDIVHGLVSQSYFDDLPMKIEPNETGAQLETLRVLGNAIRQHRQLLERRQHDYVAKIELKIPLR